jgi:hypothetical protein
VQRAGSKQIMMNKSFAAPPVTDTTVLLVVVGKHMHEITNWPQLSTTSTLVFQVSNIDEEEKNLINIDEQIIVNQSTPNTSGTTRDESSHYYCSD